MPIWDKNLFFSGKFCRENVGCYDTASANSYQEFCLSGRAYRLANTSICFLSSSTIS